MTQQLPVKSIHWFREDLRLSDNPALQFGCQQGNVACIYIHHPSTSNALGGASRWWLHQSLKALNIQLKGNLRCFIGEPIDIIQRITTELNIQSLTWNQPLAPPTNDTATLSSDTSIIAKLADAGLQVKTFDKNLLWQASSIRKKDGSAYKIFTPFYNYAKSNCHVRYPVAASVPYDPWPPSTEEVSIDDLQLLPEKKWYKTLEEHCQPGELAAKEKLSEFLHNGIQQYQQLRDFPAQQSTSTLSAHLHFGEISAQQIWHATLQHQANENGHAFVRQLVWRDFSYYQLQHFPTMIDNNMKTEFNHFPYRQDINALQRWQKGQTGIPIIDAGMRELWTTGNMHNRVRLLVASFLVKNLRLHWTLGAEWFLDCLVDADNANNSANWQWVAGSGCDAAPYFRIFNPQTQSQKFDSQGHYIRRYCPELSALSNKHIHAPWLCDKTTLLLAGITLGEHYPEPMVDLKLSREQALEGLQVMKSRIAAES